MKDYDSFRAMYRAIIKRVHLKGLTIVVLPKKKLPGLPKQWGNFKVKYR